MRGKANGGALYDGFFDPLFETFSLFSVFVFPFASLELRAVVDSFTQDEKQEFFFFFGQERRRWEDDSALTNGGRVQSWGA